MSIKLIIWLGVILLHLVISTVIVHQTMEMLTQNYPMILMFQGNDVTKVSKLFTLAAVLSFVPIVNICFVVLFKVFGFQMLNK